MTFAIIFDIGGVLVDLDIPRCREAFIERMGFTGIKDLLDPSHQKGFYSDMEEGRISAEEFRSKVLEASKAGAVPEDVDYCIYALLAGMDKDKAFLLKELHAKGYELYLLSNNNPISMNACRSIMAEAGLETEKIFKDEFLSYEMKMLKPSLDIYKEVIRRIGRPSSEIMFIDDALSNVEAALSLGIKALHYIPGTDLRALVNNALAAEKEAER